MARKLVNTKKISHEEWLELRKRSIGGSDAAAVAGMSQWSSPMTVYCDKKGLSKAIESNERMRLGNDLEQYVAERYMEDSGKKVRQDNFMYQHDEYDFITANVDRVIVGENAGLECKTMGGYSKYDLANGEVPQNYWVQCQHYMMVMGYDYMDLAVLVLQDGIYINRIQRNDEFIDSLLKAEVDFWTNYVEQGVMPALDGSEATSSAMQEIFAESYENNDVELPSLDEMIRAYKSIDEQISELKERKDAIKNKCCKLLSDRESSSGHGFKYGCSWKSQERTSIDSVRLKKEMPDVYARYSKTSQSKVFRTREIKGA